MDITIDDNRNVYVVSDIHNYADGFKRLLKKIQFNENDLLIIDGDIFDRGDKPVELYFEILKYPNIQVIQGNHDVWVARQIIEQFGHRKTGEYISYNTVAIMEKRLTAVDMLRLAEWIQEKPYYINLTINGRKYQIAHAQTFLTPERMLDKRKIYMGDGHTISHVDMTKENGVYSSGLFAQIGDQPSKKSGKVMLLAANGDIVSSDMVGGICGNLPAGEIYGCSFTGTVKGSMVGGISGNAGQGTMISQCFFEGDVQGRSAAAGICGNSPFTVIDHCISIAAIAGDGDRAGIVYSGDSGATNCYFNNDICNVEDEYKLGRSTQQLTSSSFFEKLKTNGFSPELWTKKANDKENGIAYYPSLGENNVVPVKYTTGLSFEITDDSTLTYGEKITFNAKALVNFVTDGQPISAEDTEGSFEIRIGDTPV